MPITELVNLLNAPQEVKKCSRKAKIQGFDLRFSQA